jgi:hypothetical protein
VQASTAVVLQATTAPPQETRTTTTPTTPPQTPTQEEPPPQALVPPVETVEEETVAQAAVEDANARMVDPDVPEEQDDRYNAANDFELHNPDDIAEHDDNRHARKWQWCELKKATLLEEEVSVGAGARKTTWKVQFDITVSDV